MKRHSFFVAATAGLLLATSSSLVQATPYASGVSVTGGTAVSFILNEPTDTLKYVINGGAPVSSTDGVGSGAHNFTIPLGATFSIIADKTSPFGFTLPKVGTTLAAATTHFPIDTQSANITINATDHLGQVSNDANGFMHYNSVRGVDISNNPNSSNFGTAYITNSADQAPTDAILTGRTSRLNKGLYAVKSDGSDAFGYGDTAALQVWGAANANTPHRIFVAADGTPYMDGASDAISGVFQLTKDLTGVTQVFNGIDGPTDINIAANNHGSVYKTVVTGSTAAGNLKVYTLDEDLSSAEVTPGGGGLTDNTNRLWRYDINGFDLSSGPYTAPPVAVTPENVHGPLLDGSAVGGSGVFITFIDMDLGKDGKFYLSQNRSNPANTSGLYVVNPDGTTAWDSITATRALPGQTPTSLDLFQNTDGIAVSPDQKWLAALHGDNFLTIVPLINGIPDIANRLAVDTGNAVASSRDINFDAAGNLWYASSGQALVRVLTPGGHTTTTLAWDGTQYTFTNAAASLAGDYNNDGKVDAQDYVLWRKSPGTYGGDPAGYNAWRANFGTGGPGSGSGLGDQAVPEPSTIAFVGFGLIAFVGCRRRAG